MTTTTTLITGNTFPVKDALRALGGRWDAAAKGWRVPSAKADQARALVSGRAAPSGGAKPWLAYARTGCSCGSREGYEGRYDCAGCRHDA